MKKPICFILLLVVSILLTCVILPVRTEAAETKITYPNGGETLFKGGTYTITWEGHEDKTFQIHLSVDSGATYDILIGGGTGGSFTWTIGPEIPLTSNARIKISYFGMQGWPPVFISLADVSYADFTITALIIDPIIIHPIIFSAPAAPSELTAGVLSSTSVNLAWVDNAFNEKGFRIERKMESGSYAQVAQVGANVTTYNDTGLDTGTLYIYRVKAYNDLGSSGYSNEAEVIPGPPAAPSNLTATAVSSTQVNLSWHDNAKNESGFKIERKTGSGSYAQLALVGTNVTDYSDTVLNAGTSYTYRVQAYNAIGGSSYSNEAAATTPPAAPPSLPATSTVIRLFIGNTQYYVNGTLKTMDVAPITREGRTLLPIRFVAEPLGAAVGWDTALQKATVSLGANEVGLWIGQNRARINGAYQYIDPANHNVVPIVVPPGRTMLPLRFIAETLGCQVDWNGATQEVTITYPAP